VYGLGRPKTLGETPLPGSSPDAEGGVAGSPKSGGSIADVGEMIFRSTASRTTFSEPVKSSTTWTCSASRTSTPLICEINLKHVLDMLF
jgi:hypothetical protein